MRGLGGGVLYMFALEEAAHDMRLALAAAKMSAHGVDEFSAGARTVTADVIFDVMIKQFIGVELGAVARQKEESYSAAGTGEPGLHGPCLVYGMSIDDEEHRAASLALESAQKIKEHSRGEPALEHHEQQVPSVGQGGELIATKALAGTRDHRGLAPGAEGAPGGSVGTQSHLVGPVNLSLGLLRLSSNRWVLFLQPAGDCLRIALVGPGAPAFAA